MRFGRVSYDTPLGIEGLRAGLSASQSTIQPGDERRFWRSHSEAETYEARVSFSPILTRFHSRWLTGSGGISDVSERNLFVRTFSDRIRLASIIADYKLNAIEGAWSYFSATYRRGLGLLDPHADSIYWLSRAGASDRFGLLNASFTHYQNLGGNWSVKLAAAGQLASGPLLTSQQFYLGGLSFGRGFEGGWIGGDNAVAGAVELRYDKALNRGFIKGVQIYAFSEGGVTRSYGAPNLVQGVVSAGLGARIFVTDDVQFGLSVAKPLRAVSPLRADRGATVLFSLSNALRFCPGGSQWRCG